MSTSKKDNKANSFILYQSYEAQFALLSMQKRGELISAIFEYERTGIVPEGLSKMVAIVFYSIKEGLDRNREAYNEKCKRNTENGRLGGRPRKNFSAPKTERFFEEPKKADNDYDNDNDNDFDNDERSIAPLKKDACASEGLTRGASTTKRKKGNWRGRQATAPSNSSFETDEFFEAALQRTLTCGLG